MKVGITNPEAVKMCQEAWDETEKIQKERGKKLCEAMSAYFKSELGRKIEIKEEQNEATAKSSDDAVEFVERNKQEEE